MSKRIEEIDKNFKQSQNIGKPDIKFHDVLEAPFSIHGVFMQDGMFRRIPESVAKSVNDGVHILHTNTAGGRIRFMTDSPYVAICAELDSVCRIAHGALTGTAGFDLYAKHPEGERYMGTFTPPYEGETIESIIELGNSQMREITINMPLYTNVKEVYIGLSDKAQILPPKPYTYATPTVYYGSSITQGGCASRPGNSYQAMISRRFDLEYINLGFSGSARAEDTITDYINALDMKIFVYDYDHNSPSFEHLNSTHEKMFLAIREKHPDLPIIMMSRPVYFPLGYEKERLVIHETTYKNALARGDKNVYYLDGKELMKYALGDGNVDRCHPNDLGFASMAKVVGDLMEKILE